MQKTLSFEKSNKQPQFKTPRRYRVSNFFELLMEFMINYLRYEPRHEKTCFIAYAIIAYVKTKADQLCGNCAAAD